MALTESAVRNILNDPFAHDKWTVQGLGMLRLDLDDGQRLHIWDPDRALNDVRSVHDHPYDMDSQIYFGAQGNQRYEVAPDDAGAIAMRTSQVICGIGSHLVGEASRVTIDQARPFEQYGPGEQYAMTAEELHESVPAPGTVTVIKRTARPDRDTVTMLWEGEGNWQQDEFTRVATEADIVHFVGLAVATMREQGAA